MFGDGECIGVYDGCLLGIRCGIGELWLVFDGLAIGSGELCGMDMGDLIGAWGEGTGACDAAGDCCCTW
jgi:hypothetical protein